MSDELEAVGALATAGLVASQVGGPTAPGGSPAHGAQCRNCGAALHGAFCQACGQPAHVHRSLLHLAEEVLHGILHFDAKGWRTLPLLVVRPGLLTRRYIDGQRARHVSPLALFLFTVFLMFFVFSLTSLSSVTVNVGRVTPQERADAAAELKLAEAAVAKAEAALTEARRLGAPLGDAQSALADAKVEQAANALALKAVDAALAGAARAPGAAASRGAAAASAPAVSMGAVALGSMKLDTGNARIDAALKRAQQNSELTLYKLKNTAYKFSFLLVPISLPFLWLMFFWRPGITMYDHAVFSLYSLSFMSVLIIVVALLEPLKLHGVQAFLLGVVAPLHLFMQLRETHRLTFFETLWRTVVLLCVCGLVLALFVLFIIALTMG